MKKLLIVGSLIVFFTASFLVVAASSNKGNLAKKLPNCENCRVDTSRPSTN